LEIDLLEDPAIPFLCIYPKDGPPCHRGMFSIMFIVVLFIIPRSWKQPRCPLTEEWNEDILSFASKLMELENIILSEVTQTQKDMHEMYSLISGYEALPPPPKVQNTQDTVHRTQKGQEAEGPK
jgi:hypothetical protein